MVITFERNIVEHRSRAHFEGEVEISGGLIRKNTKILIYLNLTLNIGKMVIFRVYNLKYLKFIGEFLVKNVFLHKKNS